MMKTEIVATPVSIVEDKDADRENTCLNCCKRLVWQPVYHTYMHYVNGALYFDCKVKMLKVEIRQLDPETRHVYRIFKSHVPVSQINQRLDHIRLAYDVRNTSVLVDGVRHPEFA